MAAVSLGFLSSGDGGKGTLVQPLKYAQHDFLEVLVHDFELQRTDDGVELNVEISEEQEALWNRACRKEAKVRYPALDDARAVARVKKKLEAILFEGTLDRYRHKGVSFPFRYVSGGALPIIRIAESEYYCLFFREIPPIGWNIANGASDTAHELRRPFDTACRELREELIIINRQQALRYVLESDFVPLIEMPEHLVALRLYDAAMTRRLDQPFGTFVTRSKEMVWKDAPDRLNVSVAGESFSFSNCFVNINAEDFGIEIDRVAVIDLGEDDQLLDGELFDSKLVAAPIGLFEVQKTHAAMMQRSDVFTPDILFYYGKRRDASTEFRNVIPDFIKHIRGTFGTEILAKWDATTEESERFDLCPVTKSLIRRRALGATVDQLISGVEEIKKLRDQVDQHCRVLGNGPEGKRAAAALKDLQLLEHETTQKQPRRGEILRLIGALSDTLTLVDYASSGWQAIAPHVLPLILRYRGL